MSIFAKIAEDPAMKAQLAASKEKAPEERSSRAKDFDGPDGNYVARFNGQRTADKNGNTLCFFEYVIVGGEHEGSRVSRLFWFAAEDPSEMTMDNLVNTCRTLGVDTDKDIDPQLDKVVRSGQQFEVGIVTDKKGYRTVYVNRVHEAPEVPAKEEPADEWTEDLKSEEAYGHGPSLKGETVKCGDDTCVVLTHDMKAGVLVLANPDDHDEIWYEDAQITDVCPF